MHDSFLAELGLLEPVIEPFLLGDLKRRSEALVVGTKTE